MLFNSIDFLVFFPIVTAVFFLLPIRFRIPWLLLASCYFYMSFIPVYILILFITIVIDYYAGMLIEKADSPKRKRNILIVSIVSTCLVLFIFKYYNFFISNYTALSKFFNWNYSINLLEIILPIGLSFHTFQSLSYVMEVYNGRQKAERNFLTYSLYVMYYPQLVAGPIERPQNLLGQFIVKHKFNYDRVVSGLRLMLWGMFKKVVIADNISLVVNASYNNPMNQSSISLIIATYLFAFQIYCDFSGYSDIARGCSRVMGIELMKNFNVPYISKSIREFWSRWHISLSTWFRDYLYIPLGGNRLGKRMHYRNLFIVFLVSGLWHGANWTFIIWGALHGLYLITGIALAPMLEKIITKLKINKNSLIFNTVQILITFHLVLLAWVFFRANSVGDALFIINKMTISLPSELVALFKSGSFLMGLEEFSIGAIVKAILFIFIIYVADVLIINKSLQTRFCQSAPFRMTLYFIIFYAIVFLGYYGETQFIYFQF